MPQRGAVVPQGAVKTRQVDAERDEIPDHRISMFHFFLPV